MHNEKERERETNTENHVRQQFAQNHAIREDDNTEYFNDY